MSLGPQIFLFSELNMASHYVIVYTATAGANGPLLGTDEEDIVLMQYLVWDAVCRKVVVFSYNLPCA